MSTTLAVVTQSKLAPKPTKREIISAMAKLKAKQMVDQQKADIEKRKVIEGKLESKVRRLMLRKPSQFEIHFDDGYRYERDGVVSYNGVSIRLCMRNDQIPVEVRAMLDQVHSLPSNVRTPDEKKLRLQIAAQMDGMEWTEGSRVDALLSDSSSREALEAMLKQLEK